MVSSLLKFLDHTQTTHNTHNKQTSMPVAGFEPTILGDKGQQTYALDRGATGTGENEYMGERNVPQAHRCKYT